MAKAASRLLLSDHIWLWARGYEGGGPHLDLLRRMSHWLMKQPDLDEEALRLQVQGHDLVVLRQTMADTVAPVTVTSPSGATRELTLSRKRARNMALDHPGQRTRSVAGHRRHAEGADQCRSDQPEGIFGGHFDDRHAQAAGAGHRRRCAGVSSTAQASSFRASCRFVRPAFSTATAGWACEMRDASVVKGVGVLPVFAGLIGLLLLLGAFAATWLREGR